ncbi:hypothetical protein [Chryseobacterium defluvii]|uniref:DUF3168 domain-containing protein n=1 Tax=Chryseobacterium defluvii TaxID=160396 RepID=A0A495SLQ5_9FLAO|nr:hypothetical protein [Chryseobacterium defluvii]RKT01103.1 hypothetical protein BCF58_0317 [Chryseobacterium defluvii]
MITTFELKTIVYNIVKSSNIKSIINGDVFIDNRLFDSKKSDIVIGSLQVENTVLQPSVVLINIYAPDIQSGTSYLPDSALLNNATKLLIPLVKEIYIEAKKTNLEIEYQRDYKVDGKNEHVSVIRLQTRTINN